MRLSKNYIEGKTGIAIKALANRLKLSPNLFHLSCYSPGDGRRYQIELWNSEDGKGGIDKTWPHNAHYKTNDFDSYLEGLIDGLA